jgi:predicted MFS family arabinose efflux permease
LSTIAVPSRKQSWAPVFWLAFAFMLNYADRQFFFAVFPQVRQNLSLSDTMLGLSGSVFAWSYALAMPAVGYMADRMSRYRLVIAALLLWSLAMLGTSLSSNLHELLFWRVMMGLTEALFVPSAFALVAAIYPATSRSRAISILGLAQFAGLSLGGIFGGWSAQHWGWRHGAQALVTAGIFYAGILVWRFRKGHADREPIETPSSQGPSLSPWKMLGSLPFVLLSLVFFAFCAVLWMVYAWLPTVVHEGFQLDLAQSGVTSTLYLQIGSAIGVLAGGALGDWAASRTFTSRLEVALMGLICCSPFAWAIFSTHSLLLLESATFCFGLTSGVFIANTFACLYDFADRNHLSFATGSLNLLGGAGAGVAILLAGVFKNTVGIATLMLATLLVTDGFSIALFWTARRRRLQR